MISRFWGSAVFLLAALSGASVAAACTMPSTAYVTGGWYGVNPSLASLVLDPVITHHGPTGSITSSGSPVQRLHVIAIVTPEQWHRRFRSQILAPNVNNSLEPPAQRMVQAGSTYAVEFTADGDKWWLPMDQLIDGRGEPLLSNGSLHCPSSGAARFPSVPVVVHKDR